MNIVDLIEQHSFQIKNILLNDSIIKKLLYVQTPSSLSYNEDIESSLIDELIYLVPYIEDSKGVKNSIKNIFIVIYPTFIDFNNEVYDRIAFSIDIYVNHDYFILDNNKLRLHQLLKRVVELLNNKKFSFAEKFSINTSSLTNIDNGKIIGFLTNWSAVNGSTIQY